MGGVDDHLHIATSLHPSVSLASLAKDIKLAALDLIKRDELFLDFPGWQDGYGAFTYNIEALDNLVAYVQRQEAHHYGGESFPEEFKRLLQEYRVPFDEQYLL